MNFQKRTTIVMILSAASVVFLASILLVSSVAPATSAQAAQKATAKNKYSEYINHLHGGYRFLEKHTRHYNSTKSEADNLNAFQAW